MSQLVMVLFIATVAKNIVNVIKMLTITQERPAAGWLILSGVFGFLIVWLLGLKINVFESVGVEPSTLVVGANGFLIGIMGQDIYKIMKLVQQKTPLIRPDGQAKSL